MNFPLKNNRSQSKYPFHTIFALFLFCFLVGFSALFPTTVRNIFYTAGKPVWLLSDTVTGSFHGLTSYFASKATLQKENLKLQDELTSLRLTEVDNDILTQENQTLKGELGRTGTTTRIVASVLSKPPRSPYDTLVIDVGSDNGISKGNKVYASDTVIVGLVADVTPRTSLVTLFSDASQKQQAEDLRTGASFEMAGKGGANFQIEVPKDTDILWGDSFVYPGINTSVIGSVYYIDTSSQSSFKTIHIRIPGNIFESKSVFVEKI